ncbi:MAG: restriction endonuclease subunit S, partial [Oscillospiraceae bacterium]|nr:restriction endonuclease subunit S [Oscillospiraceae bacterium]
RVFESKTTGLHNLRINDFVSRYEVPETNIAEQKKICELLDRLSNIVRKRKQELQMMDELIKARFVEMFGDPIINSKGLQEFPLMEICEHIYGGGTPSKSHPEYYDGDIPWISPKDMKSVTIYESTDYITDEAVKNSATCIVPAESVLMVIRSGILKHNLPVAINKVEVAINQDMKAFIPSSNITSEYLLYYFKAIESDVLRRVRGVTADNIDFKEFQKRKIVVPLREQQEKFSEFVQQADKSKTNFNPFNFIAIIFLQ